MSGGLVSSRDPGLLTVGPGRRGARRGDRDADRRPVVVVLGMHRSGTSLLANLLHYLGVDMADTSDHVSARNAGGFWERPALNLLQDEVLAAIGRPIAAPAHCLPFPPAWWRRKEVQAIKPRIVDHLEGELARSSNLWGFKDPRTCRLLPLWWEIFRELDLEPIYVHAVRAPAESAVSMSLKNPARAISATQGELMWLAYNQDILRYVALDAPTLTVAYDEWFTDGAAVARRLADALDIGSEFGDADLRDCVETLVSPELRHHVVGEAAAVSRMPIANMVYEAIVAAQRDPAAGARLLRSQSSFVELMMKSVTPLVEEQAAAHMSSGIDRSVAEADRGRDLEAALAERDARIATLEARLAAQAATASLAKRLFVWPGADDARSAGADYGLTGAIERVDGTGFSGRVAFAARPDLVPVVELAIDGAIVLAQACTPADGHHAFFIAWRDVPAGSAGRKAILRVAGIERAIDGPELVVPGR